LCVEYTTLGDPGVDMEDNIKMDLQEVGCGGMDWIELVHFRDRWRELVSAVMKLRLLQNARNFLTSLESIIFSRRTLLHRVINSGAIQLQTTLHVLPYGTYLTTSEYYVSDNITCRIILRVG